ncbi:hypothetical protein Hte_007966 [Hypoxylon texense]
MSTDNTGACPVCQTPCNGVDCDNCNSQDAMIAADAAVEAAAEAEAQEAEMASEESKK